MYGSGVELKVKRGLNGWIVEKFVIEPVSGIFKFDEVSYRADSKDDAVDFAVDTMNAEGGPGVVVLTGMGDFQKLIENDYYYYWKQYEMGV